MPSRARRGVPAQHSSQDEVCANRPKAALKAPPLLSFGGRALLPAPRDLRLRKGSAQRRREASPSAQAGASQRTMRLRTHSVPYGPEAAPKAPPLLSFGGRALYPTIRDHRLRLGSAHRRIEASPSAQGPPSAQLALERVPSIWAGGGPQGAAAALIRRQCPSPGPRGTQGSRGKRTPPYRSRAERSRGLPAHNAS